MKNYPGGKMADDPETKKKHAAKLFGEVANVKTCDNPQPLLPRLLEPFEWNEAVAHLHCKKCDLVIEINRNLAENLATQANITLPASLEGMYLQQDMCMLCSFKNTGFVLKKIPHS